MDGLKLVWSGKYGCNDKSCGNVFFLSFRCGLVWVICVRTCPSAGIRLHFSSNLILVALVTNAVAGGSYTWHTACDEKLRSTTSVGQPDAAVNFPLPVTVDLCPLLITNAQRRIFLIPLLFVVSNCFSFRTPPVFILNPEGWLVVEIFVLVVQSRPFSEWFKRRLGCIIYSASPVITWRYANFTPSPMVYVLAAFECIELHEPTKSPDCGVQTASYLEAPLKAGIPIQGTEYRSLVSVMRLFLEKTRNDFRVVVQRPSCVTRADSQIYGHSLPINNFAQDAENSKNRHASAFSV